MTHFLPAYAFLIFVTLAPFSGYAQQVKLQPAAGADLSSFGEAVDISGDGQFAIVGADGDGLHGENAGAAFIFVRDGKQYKQMARLAPPDLETFDFFGRSVAISDDGFWAIVGAPGDDDEGASSGSAYVFSRISGSWKLQAKLTASDGAGQDSFGEAVAISAKGEYALVGAIRDDDAGVDAGSAYVFLNTGSSWKEQAKLTASNSADGLLFGRILTLSSDGAYALFGVENDEVNGMLSGSAYVFARTGSAWKEQAQIIPDDGAIQDFFGKSVSLNADGKYALISANGDDDLGPSSGSAYIYERRNDAWIFKDKLTASDGDTGDLFGDAVSMSSDGRYAVVGASFDEDGANGAGSAYVFELSGDKWIEKAKIMADVPVEDGRMGAAVAMSANAAYVIIGPRFDSADLTGGTYIFGGTTLPVDLTGFIATANADKVSSPVENSQRSQQRRLLR